MTGELGNSFDKQALEQIAERLSAEIRRRMPVSLSLAEAKALAGFAEANALSMTLPIVVAVTDARGEEILFHRMEGALPASSDLARNKAYTAAAFRMATDELGREAQPGKSLYGVESGNRGQVVVFGGGFPVRRGGAVIGAIGVSGGTVAEDMQIARHALDTFYQNSDFQNSGISLGKD